MEKMGHVDITEVLWRDAFAHPLFLRVAPDSDQAALTTALRNEVRTSRIVPFTIDCELEIDVPSPYAPFMTMVKSWFDSLGEHEAEEYLARADLYPLHRGLIRDFLCGIPEIRSEDILGEEIAYEQSRFRRDVVSLLTSINQTVLILLRHAERMPEASIELLRGIGRKPGRLGIIAIFPELPTVIPERLLGFQELMTEMMAQHHVIDVAVGPPLSPIQPPAECAPRSEDIIHLFNFGCFAEATRASAMLLKSDLGRDQLKDFVLRHCVAASSFYKGEPDDHLIRVEEYLAAARQSGKSRWICRSLRLSAEVRMGQKDTSGALRMANEALTVAEEAQDHQEVMLCEFIIFRASASVSDGIANRRHYVELFGKLARRFELFKTDNHLAYLWTDPIMLQQVQRETGSATALNICEKGIELAVELKNEQRLASAFQSLGLLLQNDDRLDEAKDAYLRAIAITSAFGSDYERAQLHNGLGFFHLFQGDFTEAMRHYQHSLELLQTLVKFDELSTTLINIAFCYFFSQHFRQALKYLDTAQEIMDHAGLTELKFHPEPFICSLRALCCLKSGRLHQAREDVRVFEAAGKHLSGQMLEYYYWLKAELAWSEGDGTASDEFFRKAVTSLEVLHGETRHVRIFCCIEWGKMLQDSDRSRDADVAFQRAAALMAGRPHFDYYVEMVEALRAGRPAVKAMKLPVFAFNAAVLIRQVKQESNLNQLRKRILEINLMANLQKVLFTKRELRTGLVESGRLLRNSFLIDSCVIALNDFSERDDTVPGKFSIVFSSGNQRDKEWETFIRSLQHRYTARPEARRSQFAEGEGFADFDRFALIPLINEQRNFGFILCLARAGHSFIRDDELKTLVLIGKQMAIAVELSMAHEKLLVAASTDELTKVANRKTLRERVDHERKRALRAAGGEKARFCLLYLDLDNFKYCNDSYGHAAGDFVLKYFANMVLSCIRDIDTLGRVGGDEFAVLLIDSGVEDAVAVCKRILESLKDQSLIEKKILSNDPLAFKLHPYKIIGCSIGVACYDAVRKPELDEIFGLADEALYRAKRGGKNRYEVAPLSR